MSLPAIRAALESRLAALSPTLLTLYQNTAQEPPAASSTPYQKASLMPATPDNAVQGAAVYREHGIFQVSLMYPPGVGPGVAEARASLLRTHFKRGTTLTFGGTTVLITHTPGIAQGFQDGTRWHVPVSIRWQSWVGT